MEEEEEVVVGEQESLHRVRYPLNVNTVNKDHVMMRLDSVLGLVSSIEVISYEDDCDIVASNDKSVIHPGGSDENLPDIKMVPKCAQGESTVKGMIYPSTDNTINKDDDIMRLDSMLGLVSGIEVIPSEGDCDTVASNDKCVIHPGDSDENVPVKMVFKCAEGESMALEHVHILEFHGELHRRGIQNLDQNSIEEMVPSRFVNISFCRVTGRDLILSKDANGESSETTIEEALEENVLICCVSAKKIKFFLDSGAEHHICRDRFCMHDFKKLPKKDFVELISADGKPFTAKNRGNIMYHEIKLHDVLFTSEVGFNVISVAKLDKQGLMVCIGGGMFTIYSVDQTKVVGEGHLNKEDNDYEFRTLNWCLPKKDRNERVLVEEDQKQDKEQEEDWIIDSACARHMVSKRSMLSDDVPEKRRFTTATGSIETTRRGNASTGSVFLSEVLYSPAIQHNLMSVAQLDKKNFSFTFHKGRCQIQSRDTLEEKGYGILNPMTNRYLLKEFNERETPATTTPAPTTSGPKHKKRRVGSK